MRKGRRHFRPFKLTLLFIFQLTLLFSSRVQAVVIIFPQGPTLSTTNDNFASAEVLNGDYFRLAGLFQTATAETNEPSHNGSPATNSRWYRWTAHSACAPVFVNQPIVSLPSTLRFAIYTGTSLTNLQSIPLTNWQFQALRGQSYYFVVDQAPLQTPTNGLPPFPRPPIPLLSAVEGDVGSIDNTERSLSMSVLPSYDIIFRAPSLEISSATAATPAKAHTIELSPTDTADVIQEATVFMDGVAYATKTNSPFTFDLQVSLSKSVDVTARATTVDGTVLISAVRPFAFLPLNDNFADAISRPGVALGETVSSSSYLATRESAEPIHFGSEPARPSTWWKWTPTHEALTALNVGRGNIAVYTGTTLEDLQLVQSDYSSGSFTFTVRAWMAGGNWSGSSPVGTFSSRTFQAHAGQTYWIADATGGGSNYWSLTQMFQWIETSPSHVGSPTDFYLAGDLSISPPGAVTVVIQRQIAGEYGYTTQTLTNYTAANPGSKIWSWTPPYLGQFMVKITAEYSTGGGWFTNFLINPLVDNDDFAAARELPASLIGRHEFMTGPASVQPTEPALGTNTSAGTYWWRWTPSEAGAVRFKVGNSTSGGYPIHIFTGSALTNLTRISSNEGRTFLPPLQGYAELRAVAGQNYFIRVMDPNKNPAIWTTALEVEPLEAPLPGLIALTCATGQPNPAGTIQWTVFAKVLNTNGSPAVSWTLGQFMLGKSVDALKPAVSWPLLVDNGSNPTLIGTVNLGLVAPAGINAGDEVFVQLRAWDYQYGWTYEFARAAGGPVGRSRLVAIRAGSELSGPAVLDQIGDVRLALPTQPFTPGELRVEKFSPNSLQLRLSGPAAIYSIETSSPAMQWFHAVLVTNVTGQVSFVLPQTNSAPCFYRSRLLE